MRRRTWGWRLALAGGLLLAPVAAHAGDVAMIPMRIEATVRPGADYTTVLQVQHLDDGTTGQTPFRVALTEEDWTMNSFGRVEFAAGPPSPVSARPLLHFSPGEQTLNPGQAMAVRVSIIVPAGTPPGEYRAALVAQPRLPYRPLTQGDKRLEMQLRLASMIYVIVPPVERRVELTNLLVASDGDRLFVEPELANRGAATARFVDSYEIFSAEAAPDTALPLCRARSEEAGVALPGQVRYLRRNLPCELGPGRYRLVYRTETGADQPVLEGVREFSLPLPEDLVRRAASTPDKPSADPVNRR